MSYVVSFTQYQPSPRFDGQAWTEVRVEESTTEDGPWTQIDLIALSPLDTDPTQPAIRNLTTAQATLAAGWYRLTFLDPPGNEELTQPVFSPAPSPASQAYATAGDLRSYTGLNSTQLPDVLATRVLLSASQDLDNVLFAATPWPDPALPSGRRLDASQLNTTVNSALVRACCAQAEYRLEMGESFFIRAQFRSASGPDFNTQGRLPRIGPKVRNELTGSGLMPTGARATAGNRSRADRGFFSPGTPAWPLTPES